MKIFELIIKGKERYDYSDVANELAWREGDRPGKLVQTNIKDITLDVKKRESGGYEVLILSQGKPVGFIDFVHPIGREITRRNLLSDTWTPHSGILKSHTGKGYTSAVYRWFLDAGHNLITGFEQTHASNNMWRSLSKQYQLQFINDSTGKVIKHITPEVAQQKTTRMLLIGKGNHGLKEEQLQELALKKDVPYKITHGTRWSFSTEATIGGRVIKFSATKIEDEWEIIFTEEKDGRHRTYDATGSGAEFEVLSMVVRSLKEFIARFMPDSFSFTVENAKRASIYRRAIKQHIHNFKETDKDVHGHDLEEDTIRYVHK